MSHLVEQYRANLEKVLYEPGVLSDWLAVAEEKTKVKRIYIALGITHL